MPATERAGWPSDGQSAGGRITARGPGSPKSVVLHGIAGIVHRYVAPSRLAQGT